MTKKQPPFKLSPHFFKWLYLHPDFRLIWLQALSTGLEKFEATFVKLAKKGKKTAAVREYWMRELAEGKKIILADNKPPELEISTEDQPQSLYILPAVEVISYLNQQTGQSIRLNNLSVISLIEARLREKHTIEQFKYVIDNKITQWKGTEYEIYLRPTTLFAAKHFEEYANEPLAKKREEKPAKNLGRFANMSEVINSAKREGI